MFDNIKKAAEGILEFREKVKNKAIEVRKNGREYLNKLEDRVENELIIEVKESNVEDMVIAAVDSGVYSKEMHTFELDYIRTLSVVFEYKGGRLSSAYNFPDFPKEIIETTSNEEVEAVRFRNLLRMREEIEMAIAVSEKYKLDYLFIDGSLLPLLSDKPREDSEIYGFYKEVCRKYQKLFEISFEKGVDVVGVIKDAKSRKFSKKLEVGNVGVDTFFLEFMLEKGERTTAFKHTHEDKALFSLIPKARDVLVFYIKPSLNDRPLRIEFLPSKSSFDEIASLIYSLSSLSENYAYPSILFEVDKRVAVSRNDAEIIDKYIMLHSNSFLEPKRRDNRPFR